MLRSINHHGQHRIVSTPFGLAAHHRVVRLIAIGVVFARVNCTAWTSAVWRKNLSTFRCCSHRLRLDELLYM